MAVNRCNRCARTLSICDCMARRGRRHRGLLAPIRAEVARWQAFIERTKIKLE